MEPKKITNHDEKRMELRAHLAELRSRLMRSLGYILLGALIAYQIFPSVYGLLYRPLASEMVRQNRERMHVVNTITLESAPANGETPTKQEHDKVVRDIQKILENPPSKPIMAIIFRNFWAPFMMRLSMSLIFGAVMVSPLILWELALFVLPALTPRERRPFRLLFPISVVLLMAGIYLGYRTMFFAMHWFLSFLDDFPQPAVLMQDPNDYILFFVKLMAVFGLVFQLPVILMGLAFLGLITSKGLLKGWRFGILLASLGSLLVPSNDYMTMSLIGVSIIVLYFLSYFFVRLVERLKIRYKELDSAE